MGRAVSWGWLLTALLVAPAVHGTLVRSHSLRGLVLQSDAIVRGQVTGQDVVYDPWWGRVYTHTSVRIDGSLSGTSRVGETIVVRQLGGVLDGIETHVVGNGQLPLGSDVVLLTRSDGAFHYLVGMAQGCFVAQETVGGSVVLTRDLGGLTTARARPPRAARAPDTLTLADLQREIARIGLGERSP